MLVVKIGEVSEGVDGDLYLVFLGSCPRQRQSK